MPRLRDHPCERCGQPAASRFCSVSCSNARGRSANPRERGGIDKRRRARDVAAPGLTHAQRQRLRAMWIAQRRACTYCPARCEQVDHVIPLARGGTNHEGNLTPSCARCNRRKGAMTITEWRHRGRVAWTIVEPPPRARPAPRPARIPKPIKQPHPCPLCQTPTRRPVYCSPACCMEMNARYARDRGRTRRGLPSRIDEPTKPRKRAA